MPAISALKPHKILSGQKNTYPKTAERDNGPLNPLSLRRVFASDFDAPRWIGEDFCSEGSSVNELVVRLSSLVWFSLVWLVSHAARVRLTNWRAPHNNRSMSAVITD